MRTRWVVVAVAAMCLLLALAPYSFRLARVEGPAMAPALADQDRVFVNGWAYAMSPPRRGDIVMLRYPPDPRRSFVKRIVAAGGDAIRIDDGRVYVNDRPVDEPYVVPEARSHDARPVQIVPAGHYFVLGDRRNNSSDSRHWGLVPEESIIGRVSVRIWPGVGVPR
jgi:signal peptidase I